MECGSYKGMKMKRKGKDLQVQNSVADWYSWYPVWIYER